MLSRQEREPKKEGENRFLIAMSELKAAENREERVIRPMEQPCYWNTRSEYHPKNRLLRYSKSSKISDETLRVLWHLRKTYSRLPAIIYSLRDREESEGMPSESDNRCQDPFLRLQTMPSSNTTYLGNRAGYPSVIKRRFGDRPNSMSPTASINESDTASIQP